MFSLQDLHGVILVFIYLQFGSESAWDVAQTTSFASLQGRQRAQPVLLYASYQCFTTHFILQFFKKLSKLMLFFSPFLSL